MSKKLTALVVTTFLTAFAAYSSHAEEQADYSNTLTGDWGGARTSLSQKGIELEAVYKLDIWDNLEGGIKSGSRVLDNLDVTATFNGEKLWNVPGNTVFIHLLNNNGGRPNKDLVGSVQGIDNIETSKATAKLYQVWMEQTFWGDKASVKGGLYDLNTEFNVIPSGGVFLHPVYGTSAEFAATGENGPSVFPNTSLAARLYVAPTENWYVQGAVLDGVPGDPQNPKGTHIHLSDREGALLIGEAGYKIPDATKDQPAFTQVSVGAWRYTREADDFVDVGANGTPAKSHSQGVYLMVDQSLYQEAGRPGQGLRGFARYGVTDGDVTILDYAWSAGLVYTGLVPGRDEDIAGLAVHQAHNADKFQQAARAAGGAIESAETGVELTYQAKVLPWLTIQPDIQFINNPGADPAREDSWVVGSRFMVTF